MTIGREKRRRGAAFSLVELVIVIMVLGILAGIAAPRLLRTTEQASAQAVINDVFAIFTAAELYEAQNGKLPANAPKGVLPTELAGVLDNRLFTDGTPIGGVYDWNGPGTSAVVYGVAIQGPLDNRIRLRLEKQFDDGNLTTGWITAAKDAGIKFELAPNPRTSVEEASEPTTSFPN